jgi:hypothetical protein
LAKRSDDVSLVRLRAAGADPGQIVSWVARSCGVNAPARVDAREIVDRFDIKRLPRADVQITRAVLREFGL